MNRFEEWDEVKSMLTGNTDDRESMSTDDWRGLRVDDGGYGTQGWSMPEDWEIDLDIRPRKCDNIKLLAATVGLLWPNVSSVSSGRFHCIFTPALTAESWKIYGQLVEEWAFSEQEGDWHIEANAELLKFCITIQHGVKGFEWWNDCIGYWKSLILNASNSERTLRQHLIAEMERREEEAWGAEIFHLLHAEYGPIPRHEEGMFLMVGQVIGQVKVRGK